VCGGGETILVVVLKQSSIFLERRRVSHGMGLLTVIKSFVRNRNVSAPKRVVTTSTFSISEITFGRVLENIRHNSTARRW